MNATLMAIIATASVADMGVTPWGVARAHRKHSAAVKARRANNRAARAAKRRNRR